MTKITISLALMLLTTPAWSQSDVRFRGQMHCPQDSLHYGMTVMNSIANCYKPARRNDGPVHRGYENPNRVVTTKQKRG